MLINGSNGSVMLNMMLLSAKYSFFLIRYLTINFSLLLKGPKSFAELFSLRKNID